MTELTTEELELEIVRYDKQKLISYCLKLFITNRKLVYTNEALHKAAKLIEVHREELKVEVNRLKGRTLWQVLNERIEKRIHDKRNKRQKNET